MVIIITKYNVEINLLYLNFYRKNMPNKINYFKYHFFLNIYLRKSIIIHNNTHNTKI